MSYTSLTISYTFDIQPPYTLVCNLYVRHNILYLTLTYRGCILTIAPAGMATQEHQEISLMKFARVSNLRRGIGRPHRSEEHTSELQSLRHLVCRLLLEKKKKNNS